MERRTPEGIAAKKEYSLQYRRNNYEQITFDVEKGGKQRLKDRASKHGMTLKGYILTSIDYYDRNH